MKISNVEVKTIDKNDGNVFLEIKCDRSYLNQTDEVLIPLISLNSLRFEIPEEGYFCFSSGEWINEDEVAMVKMRLLEKKGSGYVSITRKPKEMTISEIENELGYPIKIKEV